MEDDLARRRQLFLRGDRGDRLSRTYRFKDNYHEETTTSSTTSSTTSTTTTSREERNATKTMDYEHNRIPEEIESNNKTEIDSGGRNRKHNNPSKSNYKLMTTNASMRRSLSPESISSWSSAPSFLYPISDNNPSTDSTDNSVGLGSIGIISQNHIYGIYGIMIVLIGLSVILLIKLVFLLCKPFIRFVKRKLRRHFAENQKRIERRYKTIDKWLIQKTVQPHDDITCKTTQNYARLHNGENSLGGYAHTVDRNHDPSPHTTSTAQTQTTDSHPRLCLTASFDTNTSTHGCSSCSISFSSSSDRNGVDDLLSNDAENLEYDEGVSPEHQHDRTTTNHSIAAILSKMTDAESDDAIDNIRDSEEIQYTSGTSNNNQSLGKVSSPVDCGMELDEHRHLPKREMLSLRPMRDSSSSSSSDEETAVDVQPVLLTREQQQVLETMKITKSKPNKKAKNAASYYSGVLRRFDSRDDEREAGCPSDEEEDEADPKQECSICMETFEVGNTISFSPMEGCCHAFHHDCLRQWLLQKTGCPCCRAIILPIDRPKHNDRDRDHDGSAPLPPIPWNRRAMELLRSKSSLPKKPWNRNTDAKVLRERWNKKCGTHYCVACGVVVVKPDLREDLCTKTPTR